MIWHILNNIKRLRDFGAEFEQAVIRLVACVILSFYSFVCYLFDSIDIAILNLFLATIPCCILFMIWSYKDNNINPVRMTLAILTGVGATTYALALSDEVAAPIIVIYFWIILGNGLRFGSKYLLINTVLTLIGFAIVMEVSPFWSNHLFVSFGILFAIFILPMYINVLLQRLQTAVDEAKAANLAKSQFLANMSHEIRTPLNGVIGMSDILSTTTLNSDQKDFVATIQASAKSLLSLIEDILDISKIEAGKIDITHKQFDLFKLLKSIIRILSPQVENKGLKYRIHIDPCVPFDLIGDEKLLKQILINLISNAIKFTAIGSIDICVKALHKHANCVVLRFEITDTGIGISKESQTRIFDKFTQADTSISSRFGGTGLGTSIASNLVQLMGGKIGLHSVIDKGSTFWFEVTMECINDASVINQQMIASIDRILLVATHGIKHTSFVNYFAEWGIQWDHAITGPDASNLLLNNKHKTPFDLILVDHNGLGMDCELFVNQIKNNNRFKNVNFILIKENGNYIVDNSWYFSVIKTPIDKIELFNALYATTPDIYSSYDEIAISDTKTSSTKLRIIVGEDNKTNQKVLQKTLELDGHEVHIYENGELVLDALGENNYDLLILDMHMPVLDGVDTVRAYKFITPSNQQIPILMLTANATTEAANKCKEIGVDAYLTKPIQKEKLLNAIYNLANKTPDTASIDTSVIPKLKLVYNKQFNADVTIDVDILNNLALLDNNRDFMNDLVHGFLADSKQLAKSMLQANENNRFHEISDLAHAMKGSAQSIGAISLANSASIIYKKSLGYDRDVVSSLCQELLDEFKKTESALLTYLKKLDTAALQ